MSCAESVPVDELALRDAVSGDGLLLTEHGGEEWELHAVHAGHARCLGRSLSTVAALHVLDGLDLVRDSLRAAAI
jgi:hypothetical protein